MLFENKIFFPNFQLKIFLLNKAQLFDQICSQRDNMRDAIGSSDLDEDVWVPREIKFAESEDSE